MRVSAREAATSDGAGAPLWRVGAAIVALAAGLNAIVPLFPLYADRFDLSAGDLTLAFAAYAITMLPTLLVVGDLSDRIGRRPVLLPALVLMLVGSVIFAAAQGLAWLIAGRVLQGLAGGAFWGTIAAYARDLTPDAQRDRAALLVTVGFTGGLAAGALATGAVAQITGSIVVPWVAHAALMAVAVVVILRGRETVTHRRPARIHLRLSLPADHSRAFLLFLTPVTFVLVAVSVVVLNLIPLTLEELLPSAATALSGVGVAIELSLATVAQVATRRVAAYRLTQIGCGLMLVGAVTMALAAEAGIAALLFAGIALAGISTGLVFRSTLALAERMTRPEDRAAVMSAYNIVLYGGLSIPALMAGRLADAVGTTATLLIVAGLAATAVAFAFSVGRAHLGDGLRSPPGTAALSTDGA